MQRYTFGNTLRIAGLFTVAFSIVAGLLLVFVLPTACSVVGGFGLFFLGILLLIGLLSLVSGKVLEHRNRKATA